MPPIDPHCEAPDRRDDRPELIETLRRPEAYPHPVERIQLVETHLSWILLTGEHAYKVKKPVDLGFADFSTLERRRRFCEEELRLNRRYAPSIYLDVVGIRETPRGPALHGDGPVIEYAVKMRQFPQEALASRLLAAGALSHDHVRKLAERVAALHARAAVAGGHAPNGEPEAVLEAALENIGHMIGLGVAPEQQLRLRELWLWTERVFPGLREAARARKDGGFVRECHGDLHLDNLALIDGELTPFDGIEFSDALRWIDTISEIAFGVMDFAAHGRRDLAALFLNAYLERTGDYAGLDMLRFYLVYRALVRAKVALLRKPPGTGDFARYLDLAGACAKPGHPALFAMHGLSGSGKSTVAEALAQALGGIRIRSDVERKRSGSGPAPTRGESGIGAGHYAEDATRATYARMQALGARILRSGFSVIVDAACLRRWQRDALRRVAEEAGAPFTIVSVRADERTLRERLRARRAAGTDASDADLPVLQHQIEQQEPLSQDEHLNSLTVDSALPLEGPWWAACVRDLASRSGLAAGDALIALRDSSPS
jgi:uncharacterized protein